MLIDSNIIIYASKPEYPNIRQFIADNAPAVSAISYVEVLGYHKLNEALRAGASASRCVLLSLRFAPVGCGASFGARSA